MLITYRDLKLKGVKFWNQILFILRTSPYFGKLGWGFNPIFIDEDFTSRQKIKPENHQLLTNAITPDQNEEQICRSLIKTIFRLPVNYSRPEPLFNDEDTRDPENSRYLRYNSAELYIQYTPLTDADIHLEDLKMFKSKLLILLNPWNQQLINAYRLLRTKLGRVKTKLTEWQNLLKPNG